MGFPCCGMRSHSERLSRCPRSWRCGLLRPQDRVTGPRSAWTILSRPSRPSRPSRGEDPELLVSAMRKTSPRWNEADDRLFRSVRPALSAVLEGLRDAGLADWWAEHAEGDLQRRCGEPRQSFAGYDLVPLVEQHTGVSFDARAVELYVLRWAAPHGIRVTGTRFLTDVRYDADRVLNIAVHELLHPPWPPGHPVKGSLDALAADPFLAARFAGRDPDAGYNTWSRYAEEDAAQALDQFLNTRLGRNSRGDPVTRWTTSCSMAACSSLPCCCTTCCGAEVSTPRSGSYADFLARARSSPVPGGVREPLLSSGLTGASAALLRPRSLPLGPSPPRPPWQPRHAARRPCPAGPRLPASATRSRLTAPAASLARPFASSTTPLTRLP